MDQEYKAAIMGRLLRNGILGDATRSFHADKLCAHGYENDPDLATRIENRRKTSDIDTKLEVGAKRMASALGINL